MVENGVLDVIFREIKHRFHSLRIKREIGLLLGNLALEESAHEGMVEQGNSSLDFNSASVPSRFSLELLRGPHCPHDSFFFYVQLSNFPFLLL